MIKQPKDVTISHANLADAREIAEVHVRSWQTAYKDLVPASTLASLSVGNRSAKWEELLKDDDHGVLKQLIGNKIIGFSHSTKSSDQDAGSTTADIHAIYLDPAYLGQGFGKALMQQTLQQLKIRGFAKATLWVMETNTSAIAFYQSQGFSDDNKTIPYKLSDDHVVTVKRFRFRL